MKLHLLNPNMRYVSSFYYKRQGVTVMCRDNHIQYILSGTASIRIGDRTYMLEQDTLLYYPKGSVYELNALSDDFKLISVNFDFGQDEYQDTVMRVPQPYSAGEPIHAEHMMEEIAEEDSFLSGPALFYNAQEYQSYLLRIMNEFRCSMPYSRNLCSCILKELLILLHYTSQKTSLKNRQIIREILEYLESNYTLPLTNETIAVHFGYHPNYLGRLFKKNLQMTPQQYVLHLRLAQAKKLIAESTLPMMEIAFQVGFQDYPYFSAYFKKKTGLSPAEYRKQSQRNV